MRAFCFDIAAVNHYRQQELLALFGVYPRQLYETQENIAGIPMPAPLHSPRVILATMGMNVRQWASNANKCLKPREKALQEGERETPIGDGGRTS